MESGRAGPRGLVERKTVEFKENQDKLHLSENRELRLKSEFDNYGAIIASSNLDEDDALE